MDGEEDTDKLKEHERMQAGIEFWRSRHGQNLIKALNGGAEATDLANWLVALFPSMYGVDANGHDLAGMTNTEVAAFYTDLFGRKQKASNALGLAGPAKFDAHVLATALSVYVTDENLAGDTAAAFGFRVTAEGLADQSIGVRNHGDAFGVDGNTSLSVIELLQATNGSAFSGKLYDVDEDGDANDATERALRTDAHAVYSVINGE